MLLGAGSHLETEVLGDLGAGGRIAMILQVAANVVEDFALTEGEIGDHGGRIP